MVGISIITGIAGVAKYASARTTQEQVDAKIRSALESEHVTSRPTRTEVRQMIADNTESLAASLAETKQMVREMYTLMMRDAKQ